MQAAPRQLAYSLAMKITNKFLLFGYYLIFFSACISKKHKIKPMLLNEFQTPIYLKGKSVNLTDVIRPTSIKVMPDFNLMVVLESVESPYLARAYTLDSFKLITKFIKHSEEDGLITALNINYDLHSREFTVTDPVKQSLYIFSIDSIFKNLVNTKPFRKIDLRSALKVSNENINRPVLINDTIVDLRTNWTTTQYGILNFYNSSGTLLSRHSNYPEISGSFSNFELQQIFASGLSVSDDKKHLILEYYNLDILDLYDNKLNLIERVQGPNNHEPAFLRRNIRGESFLFPSKKSFFGYTGLAKMKDSTLFVLYNGEPQSTGNYHSSTLFKLNSKLEFVSKFKLDFSIFSFDIDWSNRKIYGLSHKPTPRVITYRF